VLGLAVWTSSVEALLLLLFAQAWLALLWVRQGAPFARLGRDAAALLAAVLTLAMAIEYGPRIGAAVRYDALGLPHLWLAVVSMAAWAVLACPLPWWRRGRGRLAGLALVGGLALTALLAVCPKLLAGPHAELDPFVREVWDPLLSENWPLFDRGDTAFTATALTFFLGGLPFAVVGFWRGLRQGEIARMPLLIAGSAALLFLVLALRQQRFAAYAELALLPGFALCVANLLARWGDDLPEGVRALGRAAALASATGAIGLAPMLVAGLLFGMAASASAPEPRCPAAEAARLLGSDPALVARRHRILACGNHGPEILYRSPHEVVTSPYHRNAAGLKDAHEFFTAGNEGVARAIASRRGRAWCCSVPRAPRCSPAMARPTRRSIPHSPDDTVL